MCEVYQVFRCSKCGRRSDITMIKPRNGVYKCKFCLKSGVTFIPEMVKIRDK